MLIVKIPLQNSKGIFLMRGEKVQISIEVLIGFLTLLITIIVQGMTSANRYGRVEEKVNELGIKQDKHNCLIERMVRVEDSAKSAHHRLDKIEEHCDENIRNRFKFNKKI